MLKFRISIGVLVLSILPFSIFAQSKTDTIVTIKDGVKTTTIITQSPVDTVASNDTTGEYAEYLASIDTTSLGSNLNLQAVAELFRTSKDLEEFEQRLNDKDEGVNNLDLNEDGKTDYLRVVDHAEKNTHVIVLQAVVGKDQFQDVASIDVVQDGDKVSLQIVGDEDIYGTDYYIEPEEQEEVKNYPAVKVMFVVGYTPYYSPYYWGYYPPYYRPWHPYPAYYYHRHVFYHHHVYHHHHHYHGYHHGHGHRNPHARSVYNSHRVTAPINKTKRYNNNSPQRPVNKTRPSTRPVNKQPATRPATRPAKPSTRPTQPKTRPTQPKTRPAQKPSTGQQARPAKRPSTRPAKPATRPSQPKTRPAQPRPSQPKARPAQPRQPRAARPARPMRRPGRR